MKNLLLLIAMLSSATLFGQTESNPSLNKIKIFLDCQWNCDFRYFRQELQYVDFMRDRQEAEVFMQLIRQRSSNGGSQFSLQITGQESFTGMADTLVFYINPEDSESVQRDAMLENIHKGMLPYILRTPWAEKLNFTVDVPSLDEIVIAEDEDPWDAWVFQLRANGNFRGEENFKRFNLQTRFNISRITDASKIFVSTRLEKNTSEFNLESETVKNKNNSSNLFVLYAKSLTEHWSIGGFASARTSDFSNIEYSWSVKPAIEYSFTPYSENTVKELKALYRIGPVHNTYMVPTTFDVTSETLIEQNLNIEYKLIKDWGSLEFDINIDNYIRDIEQSSISFSPGIEWNIFKGFSLDLFMDFTYIANRINIPKESLTDEEILLGIRQLNSSFSYFAFFGMSYRFGSQVNNVVNTRF